MLVDSHCHLHMIDYVALNLSLDAIVQAALQEGIEHMLCVSTTLEDSQAIRNITDSYNTVSGSIGLHPTEKVKEEPTVETLMSLAKPSSIIAIGETGLDYYRPEEESEHQIERFIKHIEAAKRVKKPLIVHTRHAKKDTLAVLQSEKADTVGGVLHCFTEDWETAAKALDLGFYISFSGILTFKNAVELQAVARKIPLDRILIETDAPYLAPVPYRGKINQPLYVKYVAECFSTLKGLSFEEVASITTENFYRLFSSLTMTS